MAWSAWPSSTSTCTTATAPKTSWPATTAVLMVSFFQHPFYPFSGAGAHAANMVNLPVPAYTRGMAVRELIEQVWMPRLEAFKPEMIFISAGFDAHREDDLGQLGLVEQDYAWITWQIKDIAKRHAKGRIVSSLEGGYNLERPGAQRRGPRARSGRSMTMNRMPALVEMRDERGASSRSP